MNAFDIINDISYEKQYIFSESVSSEYNVYLVNRAFMQHVDTVMLAAEANKLSISNKRMHHDFLFYSVDAKKRYGKWAKANDDIKLALTNIMNKYKCNIDTAKVYYKMLSEEQQREMNREKVKGGKK